MRGHGELGVVGAEARAVVVPGDVGGVGRREVGGEVGGDGCVGGGKGDGWV